MAHRRTEITNHEWSLIDRLADAAKMDWFFDLTTIQKPVRIPNSPSGGYVDCTPKGYLTYSVVNDVTEAFMAENFRKFSEEEIREVRDCLIRCGIKAESLDYEIERWKRGEAGGGGA